MRRLLLALCLIALTVSARSDEAQNLDALAAEQAAKHERLKKAEERAEERKLLFVGRQAYDRGDYVTALSYLKPLGEMGYAEAQYYLAQMYEGGKGVPQDYAESVQWYRKAAEQGHASAQSRLGAAYYLGLGVLQNHVQAHMWLNLAAAQGDKPAAKARDAIAEEMTPAQIAEAQKLAQAWQPAHQ